MPLSTTWLRSSVGQKIKDAHRQDYEQLIQKTIKTKIENSLLRKGFSVQMLRESQLLDDRRPDFLIYYGFLGPIVVEVKLSSHDDLHPNKSFDKTTSYKRLHQYMKGYKVMVLMNLDLFRHQEEGKTLRHHQDLFHLVKQC